VAWAVAGRLLRASKRSVGGVGRDLLKSIRRERSDSAVPVGPSGEREAYQRWQQLSEEHDVVDRRAGLFALLGVFRLSRSLIWKRLKRSGSRGSQAMCAVGRPRAARPGQQSRFSNAALLGRACRSLLTVNLLMIALSREWSGLPDIRTVRSQNALGRVRPMTPRCGAHDA